MMKRRDTRVNFDHSRDALKRFETPSLPAQEFDDTIEDSGEDEGESAHTHTHTHTHTA